MITARWRSLGAAEAALVLLLVAAFSGTASAGLLDRIRRIRRDKVVRRGAHKAGCLAARDQGAAEAVCRRMERTCAERRILEGQGPQRRARELRRSADPGSPLNS
jgi:hypothetical protein